MKSSSFLVVLLLSGCIFLSCSQDFNANGIRNHYPQPGKIHEKIVVRTDSLKSFALYIPSGTNTNVFPCIIAFDPHGDGLLPVKLYYELAEKYGYILIGSNNAKNGLNPLEIDSIVSSLFNEAKRNLPVDTNRMYLMGFSGGARIAILSGLYKIPVKGVIGCGAGLAGASASPVNKVDYFALAGLADFNVNEIMELDYPLTQAGLRHVIATFDGVHEWPPKKHMEQSFQWFTLNAMRDGVIPGDSLLIRLILDGLQQKMEDFKRRGFILDAVQTGQKAISFSGNLVNTEQLKRETIELEKSPIYSAQLSERTKQMLTEEAERKSAMEALTVKDAGWWKNYLDQLNKGEKSRLGALLNDSATVTHARWVIREKDLRMQRLLAFIRLLCYMNATSVLTSRNEEAAVKIVTVYQYADPDNPEPDYMRAVLYARKSENNLALELLDKSVSKGFTGRLRLLEQPEFSSLKHSPGFFDLLQKIK